MAWEEGGEDVLTREDLGVAEGLLGFEASFAKADWSFI
jgi:hypothetical protein